MRLKDKADTIFATATAPGRAGVAVVRVSGPRADESLRLLTRRNPPPERVAVVRALFDLSSGVKIDEALVLRFSAPGSYTGENVVEFQVHGGRAVQAALLAGLLKIEGLRPAEPGEFTRRAVEKGRLDLTQAEAIADLVNAETEAQRLQAFAQYEGGLAALYENWRSRLIRAAAWIEAGIDFADEDIPVDAMETSRSDSARIAVEIALHLNDGRRGEILREGFHVAVIGPPNAGKSSLVNALAQRDVAIVSELPGTTRDIIEVRLDLGGYPVILADTAGLRASSDRIEQEGVRRAQERAIGADLRVMVLDGSSKEVSQNDLPDMREGLDIVVWNKSDLGGERSRPGLWVSAKTGEGLDRLIDILSVRASEQLAPTEAPVLTRVRYRTALQGAQSAIRAALETNESELAAEHIRLALRAIGRITGRVDMDDLLDVVFRDFCIGK